MPLTKAQLARHIRSRVTSNVIDDSGMDPKAVALYFLADPRDVRLVRYVGQTSAPRRRFLQHVSTARLWLPAQMPWWIKSPQLRPLYDWIRQLHEEDLRLPVMVVTGWVKCVHVARVMEREQICAHLGRGMPLLNVEQQLLGKQLQFSYGDSDFDLSGREFSENRSACPLASCSMRC